MCRPPSRCRCRWSTVCPPSGPVLITMRYPRSSPARSRHLGRLRHQMSQQRRVLLLRVRRGRNMFLRNQQQMRRRLRVDVREAQAQLILKHPLRRDFPVDNLAEQTISTHTENLNTDRHR